MGDSSAKKQGGKQDFIESFNFDSFEQIGKTKNSLYASLKSTDLETELWGTFSVAPELLLSPGFAASLSKKNLKSNKWPATGIVQYT